MEQFMEQCSARTIQKCNIKHTSSATMAVKTGAVAFGGLGIS